MVSYLHDHYLCIKIKIFEDFDFTYFFKGFQKK